MSSRKSETDSDSFFYQLPVELIYEKIRSTDDARRGRGTDEILRRELEVLGSQTQQDVFSPKEIEGARELAEQEMDVTTKRREADSQENLHPSVRAMDYTDGEDRSRRLPSPDEWRRQKDFEEARKLLERSEKREKKRILKKRVTSKTARELAMLQREREKEKQRRKEEDEKLLEQRKKEVRDMVRKLNRGYKNLVDKKWRIVDKLMHVEIKEHMLEEERRAHEAARLSVMGRAASSQGRKAPGEGTRRKKKAGGKRTTMDTKTKKRVQIAATHAPKEGKEEARGDGGIGSDNDDDDDDDDRMEEDGVGKGDGPLSSVKKTRKSEGGESTKRKSSSKGIGKLQPGDIDSETMDVIIGVLDELEDEYPPEIREEAKKRVRRRIENMVRTKRRRRANTLAGKFERYTRVHPSQLDRIEEEELRRVSEEVSEEREITQQELEEATHALVEDAKRKLIEMEKAKTIREHLTRLEEEKFDAYQKKQEQIIQFREETGLSVEAINELLGLEPLEFSPEAKKIRREMEEQRQRLEDRESKFYLKQQLEMNIKELEQEYLDKQAEVTHESESLSIEESKMQQQKTAVEAKRAALGRQREERERLEKEVAEMEAAEETETVEMEMNAKSFEATTKKLDGKYVVLVREVEDLMHEKDQADAECAIYRQAREKYDLRISEEESHLAEDLHVLSSKEVELDGRLRTLRADVERVTGDVELSKAMVREMEEKDVDASRALQRKYQDLQLRRQNLQRLSSRLDSWMEVLDGIRSAIQEKSAEIESRVEKEKSEHANDEQEFKESWRPIVDELLELRLFKSKPKARKGEDMASVEEELKLAEEEFEKSMKGWSERLAQSREGMNRKRELGDLAMILKETVSSEVKLFQHATKMTTSQMEKTLATEFSTRAKSSTFGGGDSDGSTA